MNMRQAGRLWLVLAIMTLVFSASAEAWDRNDYAVKNAFREAVRPAAAATVRLSSGGRHVALGAIVSADGLILSKASELRGEIQCQLADGRQLPARIVNTDKSLDVALLRIDARELPVVSWGGELEPVVGSWLATPGMGTLPLSIGVVSVAPRKIARRLPALGIVLENGETGPRVDRVAKGSAAEKAGIAAGDVITHLNDDEAKNRDHLIERIRAFQPGDAVRLKLRRGEQSLVIDAVLGELEAVIVADASEDEVDVEGKLSDRRTDFPLALQHDTVLFPYQCGGPVVDLNGKAVGINIARASRIGSYALPVSVLQPLLDRWLKAEPLAAKAATSPPSSGN